MKKPQKPPKTWTLNAFAHEAAVPRTTLRERMAGTPADPDGKFTLAQFAKALMAGPEDERIKAARLRLVSAQAAREELTLAKERDEVLGVDVVTRMMSGALLAAKSVILQTKLTKEDQNAVLLQLQAIKPSDWARETTS